MKTGRLRAFAEEVEAALEHGRYFHLITFSILFVAMTALLALARVENYAAFVHARGGFWFLASSITR